MNTDPSLMTSAGHAMETSSGSKQPLKAGKSETKPIGPTE